MLQLDDSRASAVLTLDHGKVNALDVEVLEALTDTLRTLRDAACTSLVLTGAGRAFSAGVDLHRVLDGGPAYAQRLIPALGAAFEAVFTFPKPVVAAVNGAAIAGGCVLACAADRRIAAEGAAIGASELRVGVPFPASALEILRHACGPEAEMVILGAGLWRGEEALARRLVDEVVAAEGLAARALTVADDLGAIPQPAYAMAKAQLRRPALQRIRANESGDAEVAGRWGAPETADAIRVSLERTTGKGG